MTRLGGRFLDSFVKSGLFGRDNIAASVAACKSAATRIELKHGAVGGQKRTCQRGGSIPVHTIPVPIVAGTATRTDFILVAPVLVHRCGQRRLCWTRVGQLGDGIRNAASHLGCLRRGLFVLDFSGPTRLSRRLIGTGGPVRPPNIPAEPAYPDTTTLRPLWRQLTVRFDKPLIERGE